MRDSSKQTNRQAGGESTYESNTLMSYTQSSSVCSFQGVSMNQTKLNVECVPDEAVLDELESRDRFMSVMKQLEDRAYLMSLVTGIDYHKVLQSQIDREFGVKS